MTLEDGIWDLTEDLYEELRKLLNEQSEMEKREDYDDARKLDEKRSEICYKIAIAEEYLKMIQEGMKKNSLGYGYLSLQN